MNKGNLTTFFKNAKTSVAKHSPEILTGIGIAGFITTTVLAVRATPKALMLIEDAQYEKGDTLTATEKIKAAWKPYIPATVSGVFSVACLVGASSVNAKRNAALATAYKLSEEAFLIYKDKVVETIGEKKETAIRDKVAAEKMEREPVTSKEVIITGNGKTLCFDSISSRYFESDMETIRKAVNNMNAQLIRQDYISINEFYDELGLEHTKLGDELGWNVFGTGLVDVSFSSTIAKDGRPCLVLDYSVEPRYEFYKFG